MNKRFNVFVFILAAVFAGLGSCGSTQKAAGAKTPQASLNWEGVYTGTIPSASGSGINVRLQLNKDQSFGLRYVYVDKPDSSFSYTGSFKWDAAGSIIILTTVSEMPPYYKVGENKVTQLDMQGKPIKGKLANQYVLKKEP